jgi:hypothetical protein
MTVMFLTQSLKEARPARLVQQLARAVEPPLGEVDADHLAGADAALLTMVVSSTRTMPASDPASSSPSPVMV